MLSAVAFKQECQVRYKDMPQAVFERSWEAALRTHRIVLGQNLDNATCQRVNQALQNTISYTGKGCNYDFQSVTSKTYHKVVEFLLGRSNNFSKLGLNWTHFKALAIENNPELLKNIRAELRQCLAEFPTPAPHEEVNAQAFIKNILALIPFTYPSRGCSFSIPRKDKDGVWRHHTYKVDKIIEMTPQIFSTSAPAFLLTSETAPPNLIFMGTTFPAGKGFSECFRADWNPFLSVGYLMMRFFGIDRIREALVGLDEIEVTGVSLGGALGLQLLRLLTPKERECFSRFDILRPPGLYSWNWEETFDLGPDVNIFIQPGDKVSSMGAFPTGKKVSLYESLFNEIENTLKAHARSYHGSPLTTLLKLDPEVENSQAGRIAMTVLHILLGPLLYTVALSITLVASLFELILKLIQALFP